MVQILFLLWMLPGRGAVFDFKADKLPPPADPGIVARWEEYKNAPSPVPEEMALRVLPALPDSSQRRRFVEDNFPDLARFGGARGASGAIRWLAAESCWAPFRLALWLAYTDQLSAVDQMLGYEILWDVFPGHPQSLDFLAAAHDAAVRAGREKEAARLERILFLHAPLSISAERRRQIRSTLSCAAREIFLQTAIQTGAADAVLESVAECPSPYWHALALYQKGDYEAAWRVWQEVPPARRTEILEKRFAAMALSPDALIARYGEIHAQKPSAESLRRFVRTLLQFGRVEEAARNLERRQEPAWRFWLGLAAWMSGNRAGALSAFSPAAPGETLEEATVRRYWLWRAGGPNELPTAPDVQKPLLAYYQFMQRRLRRPTPAGDAIRVGLPVVLRRKPEGFLQWKNLSRLPAPAAVTLALRPYDDAHRTDACAADLAAMGRNRYRSLLDLWKCPHFVAGKPQQCPVSPVSRLDSGFFVLATIPGDSDFFPFSPGRGLLPQPYESIIRQMADEYRLPASLLWAVMQTESSFYPRVISQAGAVGLLQVIPTTGQEIARALGQPFFHAGRLLEPPDAVRFGAWYLRRLADMFGENWALTAAAYNAGPHQVRRWLQRPRPWPVDAWVETIPFDETRRYVKLVLGRMVLFARQTGEAPPQWPMETPAPAALNPSPVH